MAVVLDMSKLRGQARKLEACKVSYLFCWRCLSVMVGFCTTTKFARSQDLCQNVKSLQGL